MSARTCWLLIDGREFQVLVVQPTNRELEELRSTFDSVEEWTMVGEPPVDEGQFDIHTNSTTRELMFAPFDSEPKPGFDSVATGDEYSIVFAVHELI